MKRVLALLLLAATPALAVFPASDSDPDMPEARRHIEAGRFELSLAILEQVLARLPGDPDVLVYVAFAHRRVGRVEEAMAAYAQALATDRNHAGALAYQGSLFLELGRRAEAEANLARLADACGDCPERTALARELARAR
jgi:tetratricopeptide (TPR) repeat protein